MLVLFSIGLAQSATLSVGGQNASFNSIQKAIDAAASGDIIEIYSGTYKEDVYVYKAVALRGIGTDAGIPIINADGKGSTITLLADGIVIEGLMITNSKDGSGIEVSSNNNTIMGNKLSRNKFGMYIYGSSGNTITGNDLDENFIAGMELESSTNNAIIKNNISNTSSLILKDAKKTGLGIDLYKSSSNNITGNTLEGNLIDAIGLYDSNDNIIEDNILGNNADGIYLSHSNDNKVAGNLIINNSKTGIFIEKSNGCLVAGNTIKNNAITGLNLWLSRNNILRNNSISGSKWNFDADSQNDIDVSNLINGRPIFYLVEKYNLVIDENSGAGTVYCINCSNITVKNLVFSNTDIGVLFDNTTKSRIEDNKFIDNEGGIVLLRSNDNYIVNNTVNNSLENGILLAYSSDKNTVTRNSAIYSLKSGLALEESWNNLITSNILSNNGMHGISINNSGMNSIKWNRGSNNAGDGLFITLPNQDNKVENNHIN
jgi:parallel beta-helix repeat protein